MRSLELLDETATEPVRVRIGRLLSVASAADFAVARIRLAALDLTDPEVSIVTRCRVLLGRLDAAMLHSQGAGGGTDALERLRVLRRFAASGRLEIRSAGLGAWDPDFSIFRSSPAVALLGAHYFGPRYPLVGPSFTIVTPDPEVVRVTARRFEALWRGAHDVLPAIREVLERTYALAMEPAPGGRRTDDPRAHRGG